MQNEFLPMNLEEMKQQNLSQVDFVLITGDAYIDHPSFGAAIIGRHLQSFGYTVAIIAQPDWKNSESIKQCGQPRLGFLVTSGNIESMVNHYYASKKKRKKDVYSLNGTFGLRPDRATIVYSNLIKQVYSDVPIILGGIEASLRRLGHYDYWTDKMRRSILLDSKADLLVYGMGEKTIVEIADSLNAGIEAKDITYVAGTVYKTKTIDHLVDQIMLPSYQEISTNKKKYASSFKIQHENTDSINGSCLVESYDDVYIVQNSPQTPLTTLELDHVFELPFSRKIHPRYTKYGTIPAFEEIEFSININRGCNGGCNFCALTYHQGRTVQMRSIDSVVQEAIELVKTPGFKGYIHDIGGPTANFNDEMCDVQKNNGSCKTKQCLWPAKCSNLKVDHSKYLKAIKAVEQVEGVKKVFIRSGLRYDYLMYEKDDAFFNHLIKNNISGQLRVAPEHISDNVLAAMGKPAGKLYEQFINKFDKLNKQANMNQFVVPYMMSSHPGSTLDDAIELALYLKKINHFPKQAQDFYPTPSTLSTVMFATNIHPLTNEPIYIPRSFEEKQMQRALMQFKDPNNYDLVYKALKQANRLDLVGTNPQCLIRPRNKTNFIPKTKKGL